MKKLVLAVSAMLLWGGAAAHHSRAGFDMTAEREIEGELVSVVWRNPHPSFSVRMTSGAEEVWTVEAWGALYHMQRTGVKREDLAVQGPIANLRATGGSITCSRSVMKKFTAPSTRRVR